MDRTKYSLSLLNKEASKMSLTINDLTALYPEQLLLEFTRQEREQTWQEIQNRNYLNVTAGWQMYLNYLCLHTLVNYFHQEQDFNFSPQVWKESELPNFWQILTGTAIELNQQRLIIIPQEEKSCSELRVPREWVDIPGWAGNYYLGIEMNLEQCWMRVWGYTTYEQLRTKGQYDAVDKTYSLPAEELNEELTALWTMVEFDWDCQLQLAPLALGEYTNSQKTLEPFLTSLSVDEVTALLAKLNRGDRGWLRLNLPFEEWRALITDDRWRHKIYQQHKLMKNSQLPTSTINLSQWLEGTFTLGWQSLTEFIYSATGVTAYAFRSFSESIPSAVEGVKLLDLGMQLGNRSVALLIGMTPEEDNKIGIRVQLHPAKEESHLPTNIKLALLNQSGETLQEFESRSQDELIQLKRFTCPRKKRFLIRVALNSYSITEEFAID